MDVSNIQTISEIQEAIVEELKKNVFFAEHDVPILFENSKTIDFDIKSAIGKIGTVVTVTTPTMSFGGQYGVENTPPYWTMEAATIVVAENPVINRNRANYATALDTALQIAQTLNTLPTFGLTSINQSSESGLILVTITFKTNIAFCYEVVQK